MKIKEEEIKATLETIAKVVDEDPKVGELTNAYNAGVDLAYAIGEMANLMYKENTKANFYSGLMLMLAEQQKEKKKK